MDNELEKRQKQRNDAIERLLFKVNQIASNSGKTFTYDIRLNTITGEEIIRLNDCDTESSTEEKRVTSISTNSNSSGSSTISHLFKNTTKLGTPT